MEASYFCSTLLRFDIPYINVNNFGLRGSFVELCHLPSGTEFTIAGHGETNQILFLLGIKFLLSGFQIHFNTESGSNEDTGIKTR